MRGSASVDIDPLDDPLLDADTKQTVVYIEDNAVNQKVMQRFETASPLKSYQPPVLQQAST